MRMRKKKNGEARLAACAEWQLHSAEELAAFREANKERFPIYLEIGCGKGGFICQMAKRHPDRLFIAVELVTDALITALERAKAEEIENLRFINLNAKELPEWFHEGEVRELYLNFSDPWPKKGHAKRRLTYRAFLDIYKPLLAEGGRICFKTDNRPLFDFSLEEFEAAGWRMEEVTYDLHHSEWMEGNVMTEYEKNFSEQGYPIHRVVAYPQ